MNLNQLEDFYYCSEQINENGIKVVLVNDPLIKNFYVSLVKYNNSINTLDANLAFKRFLSICWDIYHEISRSPISPQMAFNHRINLLNELSPKLKTQLSSDNQLTNDFKELYTILLKLKNEFLSTLLIKASLYLESDSDTSYLVSNLFSKRRDDFINSLQCTISGISSESIVDVSNLRKRQISTFLKLYSFGLPRTYEKKDVAYLMRSPVAQQLIFIGYLHDSKAKITRNLFETSVFSVEEDILSDQPTEISSETVEIEQPQEYIRNVRFTKSDSHTFDTEDKLPAWRIILRGDRGTYLDPESTHYTLDYKNDSGRFICTSVDETPVINIDQDSLIVFNTHGGGNMLVPVADSIMGIDAERYRNLQREWKHALRKLIFDTSDDTVVYRLRLAGSKTANKVNLNNWKSLDSRKIAMKDLEVDFKAVLKLLGLDSRYDEFCEAVVSIRDSHRAAGSHLISQLRESLIGRDVSEAFKSGYIAVAENENGPELSVFEIEEIIRTDENVPSNYIGKLFDLEEV